MESQPDTTNVYFMDEHRKAQWLRKLEDARKLGCVATFNFENSGPAEVIPFPRKPDDPPDGVA